MDINVRRFARVPAALRRSVKVVAHPHARDRAELGRLVEQQAALRRVATLVARGASAAEVFPAVAQEVAQVMHLPIVGVFCYDSDGAAMTVVSAWSDRPHELQPGTRWPLDGHSMTAQVLRTGRPARVEDYTDLPGALAAGARRSGLNRTAGVPIIVDGSVWGVMATSSPDTPLPGDVEDRLAEFTELLGTAISNAETREELARLADEQAALRRVATLVAQGAPPAEVFESVTAEVGGLIPADAAGLGRYETESATVVASWSRAGGSMPVGVRWPLEEGTAARLVFETGRPGRIDIYEGAPGTAAATARDRGWRSAVAAVPPELGELRAELSRVVERQTSVLKELREIAHGIHPANLAEGRLGPALRTLARRSQIPVELDLRVDTPLPERVEVASYYVVSEALTNAAKHARASVVHVVVETREGVLRVAVHDDGVGGADPARGSGLLGLKDRAEAIGGTIMLQSPPEAGTSLRVELPLDGEEP